MKAFLFLAVLLTMNSYANDFVVNDGTLMLIGEDGKLYRRGGKTPWGESSVQLPSGVKAKAINIAKMPVSERYTGFGTEVIYAETVYVMGDDGKIYYRKDDESFKQSGAQIPLSTNAIVPSSKGSSLSYEVHGDQHYLISSSGTIFSRDTKNPWKKETAQLPVGVEARELGVREFEGPWNGFGNDKFTYQYVIGNDGKFYGKKQEESQYKLSDFQLPEGVRPLASTRNKGSTLITKGAEKMFVIGDNGLIYERDNQNPWEESVAQLPYDVKAVSIAITEFVVGKRWNGFEDKKEIIKVLYAIGSDGKLYIRNLSENYFEKSVTQLPNGMKAITKAVDPRSLKEELQNAFNTIEDTGFASSVQTELGVQDLSRGFIKEVDNQDYGSEADEVRISRVIGV
jgi:hypothetical protein